MMPTLLWLGTGLMPLPQWLVLLLMIQWISSRHFIGTAALLKDAD
ncbi:hypothetical protein [Halomonas salinarum]|nr:hypothetical protein [Halomonas salinarum]